MKKYILILITALPLSVFAQVDAIQSFFSHHMEDTSFTSVFISAKMFGLVSNMDDETIDPEMKKMIESLKGLRILTTDKNPMRHYRAAMKQFNTSSYESLMTVNSDNEKVDFWIKSNDNGIQELLLLVGGDEFVMLSLVGNLDLDKISELAESMDLKGAEHLEKIKQE